MLLILIPAVLLVMGILIAKQSQWEDNSWDEIIVSMCLIWLMVVGLGLPLSRAEVHYDIMEVEEIRRSYESPKSKGTYDRAAIIDKVIESNIWIRRAHERAKSPWTNWFWPSEVLDVKPIEQ